MREVIDNMKRLHAKQRSTFADLVVSLEVIHWLGLPKDSRLSITKLHDGGLRINPKGVEKDVSGTPENMRKGLAMREYSAKEIPNDVIIAIIEQSNAHWYERTYEMPSDTNGHAWIKAALRTMHSRARCRNEKLQVLTYNTLKIGA